MENKRSTFSGSIGFVLSAAGSAVGLGNLWRFPYLAAQNGGGLFLVVYLILAVTFGFTLLVSEVSIGRKTRKSPIGAYAAMNPKWGWLGFFAVTVPFIIMPYYCAIGGWVMKYCTLYLTGQAEAPVSEGFFTSYITGIKEPIIFMAIYVFLTSFVIYRGINKGIEKLSKILMPVLLIIVIGIAVFSITLSYKDGNTLRTGIDGLKIYLVPDLSGLTLRSFMNVLLDAMGQLFFSISVAMGIMISYGSYFGDKDNLIKSVSQIEFFDTAVAFLAGVMTILPLYVFMGREGMNASGPSLLFISMPKVFASMGSVGGILGALFFVMVFTAALTSSISIMEAVVSSFMEKFHISRKKATVLEGTIAFVIGTFVCLGYNVLYFEMPLPGGSKGQILDILDFASNNFLMPIAAIGTCLLVGWAVKPQVIIDEATKNGESFRNKGLFILMVKFIAPILLTILLVQSVLGI
ncbi:MAG: sodium-dependent transporter [Lachnospiraceae bacterium]|nr:sodium-dependent transporter [Lachnospiraceae bacterium]